MSAAAIRHPLLEACGVEHGFGVRDAAVPEPLLRPKQVHGIAVAMASECVGPALPEADAMVSTEPGVYVGIVTADCVPLLMASDDGRAVAAVHAGWRGLAAGVIEAGVARLRALAAGRELVAVIGPHIGPCCYEVDAPVIDAMAEHRAASMAESMTPSRPGHALLDLGQLTRTTLLSRGLASEAIAQLPGACTRCDAIRFHSYRRDGARSGRLTHFVAARAGEA
jgi:YfiH family protein